MNKIWQPAYIALGSNLKDPVRQLTEALQALRDVRSSRLIRASSFYSSKPIGPAGQPDYVNAVVAMITQLSPHALLDELQNIEQTHGRTRDEERWGPRTLDLDILMFADRYIEDERLSVPHKELHKRDFVLGPWMEISPDVMIPKLGRVHALATALDMVNLTLLTK